MLGQITADPLENGPRSSASGSKATGLEMNILKYVKDLKEALMGQELRNTLALSRGGTSQLDLGRAGDGFEMKQAL